jgi:hypothetical protein
MANRYSQNFSLTDIFNNKKLKNKLPLINYKEKETENGKASRQTSVKSVGKQVYDISVSASRPFYKPLKASENGDIIIIGGTLVGDHNDAVESVFSALQGIKTLLGITANCIDMIRYALKESEKNKRQHGIDTKLYLRVQSMQQIESMSNKEIVALIENIMENIYFSDNFPMTQKKYKVESIKLKGAYNYEQLKKMWKDRVGE